MTQQVHSSRTGFTLLEMILALSIGMLLLVGLYYALDIHLAGTTAGRDQVDQAQVARGVLKLITHDIKDHLATLDPYPTPTSASGRTTTTAPATTEESLTFMFNLGVMGESDWMALYISKVPKASRQILSADGLYQQAEDSDLRRVVYWLVPNPDGTGGLARQEVKIVTSEDEIANMPPGVADEQSLVFSNQVTTISFEYFDGKTWQSSWDGTYVAVEGGPPVGPPIAIAINLTVIRGDNFDLNPDDPRLRTFRHVVHIPTASYSDPTITDPGTSSSTSSSTTTGGAAASGTGGAGGGGGR